MTSGPRNNATPRFWTPRNPNRDTLGPKVAKLFFADDGRPMEAMQWQREVLDVACEIDPATGLFWYRNAIAVVLRQAGKTTMSRGKVTHRSLTNPGASVLYTAQDRNKALRRLRKDFYEPLSKSPIRSLLARPRWAAGSELVRWKNGSEIFIDAAQKKSAGHGETLPEAHIDEAFAHQDARLEQAISPMMVTVRGAQKWITSAAGDSDSQFLWSKVEAGRARFEAAGPDLMSLTRSRTCYFEYSAPLDADPDDPDTWLATHPAIGYTIDLETMQSERDEMDSAEFERAYLGWWPSAKLPPAVIPSTSWEDTKLGDDEETWDGTPVWSVDVSPDRQWSAVAIAAAAVSRGRVYGEAIKHDMGTAWIVEALRRLRGEFGGDLVVLDGSGAATSLRQDLVEEGFDVRLLSTAEKVRACGAIFDAVIDGTFVHLPDPVLDGALVGAAKRNVAAGEGGFIWVRGKSLQDITPLYAVTLARFVVAEQLGDEYDIEDSILGSSEE